MSDYHVACSQCCMSLHHSRFATAAAVLVQVVAQLDGSEVGYASSDGSGSPLHSGAQQAELQLAAAWQVSLLCCALHLLYISSPQNLNIRLLMIGWLPVGKLPLLMF